MPNPTSLDPWLVGRHFGIVIDAGSSGSRLQIYSWKDPRLTNLKNNYELAYTLPKVEKGTKYGNDWMYRVEPGISSLADKSGDVGGYLQPLLNHARDHIPPFLEKETPLFLLATAGMRLLPPVKQAEILQETCHFFRHHTAFKIDEPSDVGPCGSSVRIITGEEEGLFGWIAVNYLMDGFMGQGQDHTTYGFLDMGGASTQIAFEPTTMNEDDAKNLIDVRLRLLGGQEIVHRVFVTTWLGYGTNQARERYIGHVISDLDIERQGYSDSEDVVPDPCLPKDLQLTESGHDAVPRSIVGTGSFEQCILDTSPLLNKTAPCPDSPCLMNGIHVPQIDFSVSHFIGVSEYWYSSEQIFGLGGAYDFVQYGRAAANFCSRTWNEILLRHEKLQAEHGIDEDGEGGEDGRMVTVGKWDPKLHLSRLEMQCFKAAWITNVLHEGLGLPRLTDPGGNLTSKEGIKVEKEAEKKGLGRPTFQSLESVGDIAISWTLGKMVLEASKGVPALQESRPIVDPIDDIPERTGFHIQRIRPPFFDLDAIEDKISPHLPGVLTRSSLGFSPVLFLLSITFFVCVFLFYPLRRRLRMTCLRSIRHTFKHEVDDLEEGYFLNGTPQPATKKTWMYPLRRVLSFTRSQPPPPLALHKASLWHSSAPPRVLSPTRSRSLPIPDVVASSTQYSISRSPSPAPLVEETLLSLGTAGVNQTNGLLSRSRNGSQMNLHSPGTRTVPLSRSASKGFD